MITIESATEYLSAHPNEKFWIESDPVKQDSILKLAKAYIDSSFDLRPGTEETEAYFHAVCEQAIHLLSFDKERFNLINQGVRNYKYEDIQVDVRGNLISPIVFGFLKKHKFKQKGEVV
ncbi:hypothetical protein [Jeotgalibacillus malaysiensis]|uniref:hypothetical protein n=1 Tax=Jeotgalibacillus malaysiensis TaxID=1508404 RepID=UPI00384CD0CC